MGAKTVSGKMGRALRFMGRVPDAAPVGNRTFAWTQEVPILTRGMAKAREVIFIAGPEDILDEPRAMNTLDAEQTQEAIQKQADALAGRCGAVLRAVHPDDGETLAEPPLKPHRSGTAWLWPGTNCSWQAATRTCDVMRQDKRGRPAKTAGNDCRPRDGRRLSGTNSFEVSCIRPADMHCGLTPALQKSVTPRPTPLTAVICPVAISDTALERARRSRQTKRLFCGLLHHRLRAFDQLDGDAPGVAQHG